MKKQTWQNKFLNAGTKKGLGDLSMMIGTVSDIIDSEKQSALKKQIEMIEGEKMKEFAIQQLTGMHASEGRNIIGMCISMGLRADEWEEIKKECVWLTGYEVSEIEDYIKQRRR